MRQLVPVLLEKQQLQAQSCKTCFLNSWLECHIALKRQARQFQLNSSVIRNDSEHGSRDLNDPSIFRVNINKLLYTCAINCLKLLPSAHILFPRKCAHSNKLRGDMNNKFQHLTITSIFTLQLQHRGHTYEQELASIILISLFFTTWISVATKCGCQKSLPPYQKNPLSLAKQLEGPVGTQLYWNSLTN